MRQVTITHSDGTTTQQIIHTGMKVQVDKCGTLLVVDANQTRDGLVQHYVANGYWREVFVRDIDKKYD